MAAKTEAPALDTKGKPAEWWCEQAARYKEETSRLQRKHDELEARIVQLGKDHEAALGKKLGEQAQKHRKEREQQEKQHEQQVKQLQAQHEAAVAKLLAEPREVRELREKHAQEAREAAERHQQERRALAQQLSQARG